MTIQQNVVRSKAYVTNAKYASDLLLTYPMNMSSYLILPNTSFDNMGIPYQANPYGYHPTMIAFYALSHWNKYLATDIDHHRSIFLAQVKWFIEHALTVGEDASAWPISFPSSEVPTNGSWLSALTQGCVLSVLARAYKLTQEETILELMNRVVRTFERDILDGGVSTPVGEDGIFFEEIAAYPATHKLSGFIYALLGLYDFVALTGAAHVEILIECSLLTMHRFLKEYDPGYWTRTDLLRTQLASPAQLALQAELLQILATYSGCEHCKRVALRWREYGHRFGPRLRHLVTISTETLGRGIMSRVRSALFPKPQPSSLMRVCVPLPAHPFAGGILTVLDGIAQITGNIWQMEYLTRLVGPHEEKLIIHQFGTSKMTPRHFPFVWLYTLTGFQKLVSLLRHGADYQIILPQDGVFTSAFAAMAGKLAGVRVVCIDHSTLTWPTSSIYHAERTKAVETKKNWLLPMRLLVLLSLKVYWPSLELFARISARFVDHFLIPGIPGDEIEEVCNRLKIPQSHLTRFASMIDVDQHLIPDTSSLRAQRREEKAIESNAIVIAIICRLAPEKGLDIAIDGIKQSLDALTSDIRQRVRVIVAGDGPLRTRLEESIHTNGLNENCMLWGEISPQEVLNLLAISDIFLYTSIRGACFPMAVLEAMASSCAVIASTQPIANARLLAEGRGIAVSPGDVVQTTAALVQLVNDLELCQEMGRLAREYIRAHHSPDMFRRTLLRATYWSGTDDLLRDEPKADLVHFSRSQGSS